MSQNWFGRYRLLRRISVGGMAEVWHAKSYTGDTFEKEVALKRILPHVAEDEELLAMFIEEARVAARLDHHNVCHIYELGKTNTAYYLTMEYIYGEDLRSVQKQLIRHDRRAPYAVVAALGYGIALGLEHAHTLRSAAGEPFELIHRDISPQNVMVSFAGDVKVIDFGIAKAVGRALETQAGVLKGKIGYLAPEQLEPVEVDSRVDQFSLGILLWETLAGRRLFTSPSPVATLDLIRRCDVPSLKEFRPDIPDMLLGVVEKALSRDRDERYTDCREMAGALQECLDSLGESSDTLSLLSGWMRELFPESRKPDLSPTEVKTLFSAEDRGEEVTDPRVVDDATEIFIPDTARLDIYRRQIQALLEQQNDRREGVMGEESENVDLEKVSSPRTERRSNPQEGLLFDGFVFVALGLLAWWITSVARIVW